MTDPSAPAVTAEDTSEVDLWSLAGQPPPPEARWLVVTAADGEPGGMYTARPCPGSQPRAFGGDVLICLEPDMDGPLGGGIKVAVRTVARERLVPVAAWQMAGTSAWAARILGTVIFTMSVMTSLSEQADLGELVPVDLTVAAQAAEFRSRPLDAGPYRFVQADALTLRVREGGRTVLVHRLIATGINADGHREILGFEVTSAEDGAGWLAFFRGLAASGLAGVVLVTSDAHAGLVAAIAATLPGAFWQRCRPHYADLLIMPTWRVEPLVAAA